MTAKIKSKKPIWKRWWLWIVIVFVVIIIIGVIGEEKKETKTETKQTKTQEDHFSKLVITDVRVSGNEVKVSGDTDLPDGANLTVGFDVWGRSGSDLYIGVNKKTTVSNGKFEVVLSIPQRKEFKNGPYEVSVLFTPRGQSNQIIQVIGRDGGKLEGDLVDDSGKFKILELVEKKDLQLTINPPSYTFQHPSEFSQGSAERTLAEYALAWKNQNWNKMANFSNKSWLNMRKDPAGLLEAWYDFRHLKGFEITNTQKISNVAYDITFVVQYEAMTNKISKKQITAKVIKETSTGTLSKKGQWGVNPTSALGETDVD